MELSRHMMYHVFKEEKTIAVYYHVRKFTLQQVFDKNIPVVFGKYLTDGSFTIMVLFVPEHKRLRGIGSSLLLKISKECHRDGCQTIEVDDMSNRFAKPHNIYTKLGFRYIKEDGPEMVATPQAIINYKMMINKYRITTE